MEHFNSETRALTLVTDVKDGELVTKTYNYPIFVKGLFVKKAIELGAEYEADEYVIKEGLFDKMASFIVELYDKQFTEEELVNGVKADEIIMLFVSVMMSVLGHDPKNV